VRRRDFLAATAGAIIARPLAGHAQTQAKASIIGFLGIATRSSHVSDVEAFRLGLKQLGYVDGQTIVVAEGYADGNVEQFHVLLDDVLRRGTDVVVVPGLAAALAVREQAPDMPVVAVGLPSTVIYPDLFASLHRPGGSVTGFSHFGEDLADKRVELLREVVPALTTVAILHNSVDPLYRAWGEKTEDAALQQGLKAVRLGLAKPSATELAAAMRSAGAAGAQGLIVVRDFLTHTLQHQIVRAANDLHMGTMAEQRVFVEAGGLMSYGASFPDLFRRAATYVDEILKGAEPGEMPIQLATEFVLVVNQRTAQALGFNLPPSILLRADEVIE
jgi:putative tryptophan/tyrosine transport system substrate-binding protein